MSTRKKSAAKTRQRPARRPKKPAAPAATPQAAEAPQSPPEAVASPPLPEAPPAPRAMGRKVYTRKSGEDAARSHIYFPEGLARALRIYCAGLGVPVSSMVTKFVEDGLRRQGVEVP